MKLRTKLYLFQATLATVLFTFLGATYLLYQNQYQKDIDSYIEDEINLHKKAFLTSIENANSTIQHKRSVYYAVHKMALQFLKQEPQLDLKTLKARILKHFDLPTTQIELYLIDKNYRIVETTFPQDLNFDLSLVAEAKEFLDKTRIDGKIYLAPFVSIDQMDKKYKLYSYSKLDEARYLELGFIDQTLQNFLKSLMDKNQSKHQIEVYSVVPNKKGYILNNFGKTNHSENKQSHYESLSKIPFNEASKNHVVQTAITGQPLLLNKQNQVDSYSPIYVNKMFDFLGADNIVINLKIDISEHNQLLQTAKELLMISITVIIILLVLLHSFIQRHFTCRIEKLSCSMSQQKKATDDRLLAFDDELTEIAQEYNSLFDKLSSEIQSNESLLEENKRFIADTVHQIRTPLTNIMMNAEMLKKLQSNDSLSSFIDKIDSSINMLSNSYEDLAYITTADSLEYSASLINLSQTIKGRIKFFDTISDVSGKPIVDTIDAENLMIEINQIELERLIDNNLSNAIKYGEQNKPIHIRLEHLGQSAQLVFSSFGPPIKNPEKVFDKSYREHEAQRGLGLGLNMVKGICEKNQIRYAVEYQQGKNQFIYRFKTI